MYYIFYAFFITSCPVININKTLLMTKKTHISRAHQGGGGKGAVEVAKYLRAAK